MQRTNRDMQKTLDRLAALQTDRKARQQQAIEEAVLLYEYSSGNGFAEAPLMVSGQALSPESFDQRREMEVRHFVFSIHRIHAFVTRKRLVKQAEAARLKESDRPNNRFGPPGEQSAAPSGPRRMNCQCLLLPMWPPMWRPWFTTPRRYNGFTKTAPIPVAWTALSTGS
jgi:hypothetical protein